MPTVLRIGSLRFFFYSNEPDEPPHVHIQEGSKLAKFWLDPVKLADSNGFRAHELTRMAKLVAEHKETIHKAWHEYFS